jgi:putative ABC transport system permease protein
VPGLAKAVGLAVTWRGITGVLARENARRQPGRTAATAGALMIGLALVTFVSIVAAGTKASIDRAVDASFAGNLIVQSSSTASQEGIPEAVAPALRTVPGVGVVTPVSFSEARVTGISGTQSVTGIDPDTFPSLYRIDWHQGSNEVIRALGSTGAVLTTSFADAHHLHVGNRLSLLTPSGAHVDVVVRGIASDNARLLGAITMSRQMLQQSFGQSNDAVDFVGFASGATQAEVHPAVAQLLRTEFPQAQSQTAAQFKQSQAKQVDTLLALIDVLLALAVVVSLFGIVNTLVLSIYERRRELGMLRAIGTTRSQLRQIVRYESVVTSLIGGVIGLVVGVLFALAITRSLAGAGFVLSIPVGTLIVLLAVAAVAGVIASVSPARRAARLDVLAAVSME